MNEEYCAELLKENEMLKIDLYDYKFLYEQALRAAESLNKGLDSSDKLCWFETFECFPSDSKVILLDCDQGVGEGCYIGNDKFKFFRFDLIINSDNVYRWADMPKSINR